MQLTEEQIMNALRANDQNAFEMIFRTWYSPLCNFANSFLKDKDESEEIVQNAFVAFWEKRSQIQIDTSLKSYLYRSIRNACLNAIKHEKVKRAHADHALSNSAFAEESDSTLSGELENRIEKAIATLPEQCRLVFKMSRIEELKYAEIAEQLGISIKTVENHMGKALRIMREELKDYLILLLFFMTGLD
ncbi:MAG: RNA polymerase sigma-70 factor [Flavobacteriales bacterium]